MGREGKRETRMSADEQHTYSPFTGKSHGQHGIKYTHPYESHIPAVSEHRRTI